MINAILFNWKNLKNQEKYFLITYIFLLTRPVGWLMQKYITEQAQRFSLTSSSLIVEIASNDGYLLQYAMEMGIRVLGVEPALNVAQEAQKKAFLLNAYSLGKKRRPTLRVKDIVQI